MDMPQAPRACKLYCDGEWKLNFFTDDAHPKSNQSEYNIRDIINV